MHTFQPSEIFGPGEAYAAHQIGQSRPWSYPEHTHRGFSELVYVASGTLEQRIGGVRQTLVDGDLTLVRAHDRHALAGRGFFYSNLNVPDATWQALIAYLGGPSALERAFSDPLPAVRHLPDDRRAGFEAALAALFARQGTPESHLALRCFLVEHVAATFTGDDPPSTTGSDAAPAWLRELLSELATEPLGDLRPELLARRVGKSPEHVARCFRTHLGTTPTEHLNELRLRRAALLLTHTNREIMAIASDLGFANLTWFYRLFRRRFATTPRAYRRTRSPATWRTPA